MYPRMNTLVVALVLATTCLAARAEVAVYGRVHVSLDHLDNGAEDGWSFSSNSSRIGFKADHEMSNGMRVMVQIEQDVRYDNPGGTFGTRDTFVGMRGDFGLVRLGYMDTPLKSVRDATDLFGDKIGDARNLVRLQELGADFDVRFRNGIHYRTPDSNGFRADLHHSIDNSPSDNTADSQAASSAALSWRDTQTFVAIGHQTNEATRDNATRLGAYRDIGQWRFTGLLQHAQVGYTVASAGMGARYQAGGLAWKGQYYVLRSDMPHSDAAMLALGVDYQIDPAVQLYAVLAHTDNDGNADFRMSRGGHGTSPSSVRGEAASGLSFGLIYNF